MNVKLVKTKMSALIVFVQFFKRSLIICHHSIVSGLLFILLTNEFFYFIVKNNDIDYFYSDRMQIFNKIVTTIKTKSFTVATILQCLNPLEKHNQLGI